MNASVRVKCLPTAQEPVTKVAVQINSPILIDRLDLAVAFEAVLDAEDAIAVGAKDRSLNYLAEIKEILNSWRSQLP